MAPTQSNQCDHDDTNNRMELPEPHVICTTLYHTRQIIFLMGSNGLMQIADYLGKLDIPKHALSRVVGDLKILNEAVCIQQTEVKRHAAKVGIMPLSQEAHRLVRREYPAPWEDDNVPMPTSYKGRSGIYKAKRFVAHMKKSKPKRAREKVVEKEQEDTRESPSIKKPRRSGRVVTPDKVDLIMSQNTGDKKLTKKTLFENITELIGTGKVEEYVKSVLSSGPLKLGGEIYATPTYRRMDTRSGRTKQSLIT
jgi:hypothetical protein